MTESVSSAAFVTTSHAVTDAGAGASASSSRAPAIERGEAEAIGLMRVLVECSRGFLSDVVAEELGSRVGKEAFECAESFVSARRRAGRLLASWALPVGSKPMPMRRYSHAQLRDVARLHAEGLSTTAIARKVGMTHWSVHYHLGPSGSMQAALLDVPLGEVVGEQCQCVEPVVGGSSSMAKGGAA